MKIYEYTTRCFSGGTNFYRVKVGYCSDLNHSDSGHAICIDTWNLPISPSNYITVDCNPIISSKIGRLDPNVPHTYIANSSKSRNEPYLLDLILVKIVENYN